MERDKKIQELRELKRPKVSPGYSSEKIPARNKAEGGTEGRCAKDGERGDECNLDVRPNRIHCKGRFVAVVKERKAEKRLKL